jgi:hypothetical protein
MEEIKYGSDRETRNAYGNLEGKSLGKRPTTRNMEL